MLLSSYSYAEECAQYSWVHETSRTQGGSWIWFPGKGIAKNQKDAYLLAEGQALDRLIKECQFPHKEVRFIERCIEEVGSDVVAYVRASIKHDQCSETKYASSKRRFLIESTALVGTYRQYLKLTEAKSQEEEHNRLKKLERKSQVVSLQYEFGLSSLQDLYPDADDKTDEIGFTWHVAGLGYGVRYRKHYIEVRYLLGRASIDPFIFRDTRSDELTEGQIGTSNVKSALVTVAGVYYTPLARPGWIAGIGFERWTFKLNNDASDVIATYNPLLDIGYRFGNRNRSDWWSRIWSFMPIIGKANILAELKVRLSTIIKPTANFKLLYEF